MEEEGREVLKHVCKFCSKSFPCGRSLGGHMRSHITNVSAEAEEQLTKKIQSVINGGAGSSSKVGEYDLRENPKKSWRFADSSRTEEEEAPLVVTEDKFCKECGKAFHSWKALFGHMKCHSEKAYINNNNNNLENQDSASHKAVTDSQSDNEGTGNNPNRRRRSKRRRTRFVTTASTSSVSFANPSSSVSEVEQEQEEVAMSLMMLSRDVGHWGGLNSLVESSDNNSAYFEARSYVVRTNLSSKTETAKVKLTVGSNSDSENLNSKGKKSDSLATGSAFNGLEAIKATVSINGLVKNCNEKKHHELDNQSTLEHSDQDDQANGTELDSSAKRRFSDSDQVKSNCKKGNFKCTTCNKIFHSYQALGGHRSSHKKLKGCSASRNDRSSENSIETDLNNGYVVENQQELIIGGSVNFENEEGIVTTESKKSKVHECPICLEIFSSGQALGGHKRSHFAAEGSSLVLEKPVDQEIRDFLDLNLPASAEEESNSTQVENYPPPPPPWWHPNQEPLVGLISN